MRSLFEARSGTIVRRADPAYRIGMLWLRAGRCLLLFAGLAAFAESAALAQRGPGPPTGLRCELLLNPDGVPIRAVAPAFAWVVNDPADGAVQAAYQLLVASDPAVLARNEGDVWDSGRISSRASVNVRYRGTPLRSHTTYHWKVRTWNRDGPGPYSMPQTFVTGQVTDGHVTERYPLVRTDVVPVSVAQTAPETYFIDFGKAAFGTLRLALSSPDQQVVTVHLGERVAGADSLDRLPIGTVRYRSVPLRVEPGTRTYTVQIPPDERNTRLPAILMPGAVGEVMPFRYAEVEGSPSALDAASVRQVMVHYPFDDDASYFASSDSVLNAVWELSKYTIKATTFAGVYVDGDRERIPYEADAYINQLGHYNVDAEYTLARYSHEYLITHPTWPTEWIMHSVLMAWTDYLYTGDPGSIAAHYNDLIAKTLGLLARGDGLISTQAGRVTPEVRAAIHFNGELRDIVDWPEGERDGYEMVPYNTVVNAFHYRALQFMRRIAESLGKTADARAFADHASRVQRAFDAAFFDETRGLYVDGEGSDHVSIHANLFPLAFGLVPEAHRDSVAAYVASRGMAVSVYGAQYLLEALYEVGAADSAFARLTDTGPRGWANMAYGIGSTMTLEAWGEAFKPNMDWNHAWGAAPANLIPRYLMGIRPLEPGFSKILVQPQPGPLSHAVIRVPTVRGPIDARIENEPDRFLLEVDLPANTMTRVVLPRRGETVLMDGEPVDAAAEEDVYVIDPVSSGHHIFEVLP